MILRVATFNLRYSSAPDGENSWPLRREAAVAAIESLDADVVGLQEVLPDQFSYLGERFAGYELVGVGRDDGVGQGERSCVLVRPGAWRIESYRTRWLSPEPDRPGSVGWDAELTRVATLVQLRHESGKVVGVANTHYDHAGERAQLESSRLIASWVVGRPWAVLGDLNVTPGSAPLEALGLRDAVPASAGGTFHDFTGRTDGERIDHILVTPEWEVVEAAVTHPRPGGRLPSDHWPVSATLRLS